MQVFVFFININIKHGMKKENTKNSFASLGDVNGQSTNRDINADIVEIFSLIDFN